MSTMTTRKMNLVVKELQSRFPDATVTLQTVDKGNGVILHGVSIMKENVAPIIYLENYNADMTSKEIATKVEETYYNNASAIDVQDITSKFEDYTEVRPYLRCRLIPKKGNEQFLKEYPYMDFLDLALIVSADFPNDDGNCSIKIKHDHLKIWDKSFTEVRDAAVKNTKADGYMIGNMFDILFGNGYDGADFTPNNNDNMPMYVLTNKIKINGAIAITDYKYMEMLANKCGADLVVLPSSIHEVIIVPMWDNVDVKEMTQMVREVNKAQVSPEEQLSDHAYIFRRKTGWEYEQ